MRKEFFSPKIGESHFAVLSGRAVRYVLSPVPVFGYFPGLAPHQKEFNRIKEFKTVEEAIEYFNSLSGEYKEVANERHHVKW